MKTVIIDYGSGNLRSVQQAFNRAKTDFNIDTEILISDKADDILAADHLVLPGVGAFKDCYDGLHARSGVVEALKEKVLNQKTPFLGICVGMQLLATRGLEYDGSDGLDWISGQVVEIEPNNPELKVPHMGWNLLEKTAEDHPILENIKLGKDGLHAYFVHSFHFLCDDANDLLLTTEYGSKITAMIAKDNMIGVQFHPEKSQKLGLTLINNFLNWRPNV